MSDADCQDENENPGLGEVFDWKTRRTWAVFLSIYLGLGLGIGVIFITAQVLVHKVLPFENVGLKEYLVTGIGLILCSAGIFAVYRLLKHVSRERTPASDASEALNIPKAFVAHGCGTILGTVAGQILIHIFQRQIDLPESRVFIFLLMAMIYAGGQGLFIFVAAIWYRPKSEIDTQGV